ncbi:TonB-dependent receptor [Bacteroidales bacterium OttesenSCG-928-A17]|nr:TonB-dependent receptor [Bacteroidales bacterium OttesenSCG-928-A17]
MGRLTNDKLTFTNMMKKYLIACIVLLGISLNVWAQETIEVTGKVVDSSNEPLIGVSISIKDTPGLGTVTNVDGSYKIRVNMYQHLVFSYLGYEKQEVLVKNNVINITMSESESNQLTEVVVSGTGIQQKLTVTGAITNVDAEALKSNPSGNIANALAGNVPGIIAMQTSGKPGSTAEFWIRGISTFGANSSALVLVDGFERDLNEINIEDVESFSVLKDASATAIYGSKGANGVILVNTKRGKAGKIDINVKVETMYNQLTKVPDFVDGVQYAEMVNEARTTRNQPVMFQADEIELMRMGLDPDLYPNVNWIDELLKDGAMTYRASVNMRGGGSTARYFVSGSYLDQQGMYKVDEMLKDYDTNANYKKWNYRLNTDIDITSSTVLKVGVAGSLEKFNDPGLSSDWIWNSLMGYNPVASPVLYSNGYVPAFGTGDRTNPWVMANMSGYNEIWKNNIQTNITLEQDLAFITKGMRFVGKIGYDTENSSTISRQKWPEQWKAERFRNNGEIIYTRVSQAEEMHQSSSSSGRRNEFLEANLYYDRGFGDHHVGATARYSQSSKIQTVNIGDDIKNGIALRNQSLAGRLTYRYLYRYFLEFNFGYTGSENFAAGHRFGFFPAYSGGWNIAEESFVRNNLKWLDMFKVRFSYGKVGNDDLNTRFPFLYTISDTNGYSFPDVNGGVNNYGGKYMSSLASPTISWEVSTKKDLGIDLSIFGDKFSLTADYFDDQVDGIFMQRNYLPSMLGLSSSPYANVGKTRNRGFDGNFKFQHKIGNVDITVRGNATYAKNEILEKDEESNYYTYLMEKGYMYNQARGLIALGLFKDYEDIRNSPTQNFDSNQTVMPGDIKYKDVNGDGVIDNNDRVAIGSTTVPCLIYGAGVSARWNGFDLNLHFQGAGKSSFFINGSNVYMMRSTTGWGNIFTEMANSNRWISADISGDPSTEDPNAEYPRLSYGGNANNYQASTYWLRNGSYLRLKTVELGYTVPKQLTNRLKMNNVRVFFIGTNLFTFSSFKLWDPEMGSSDGIKYPLSKTLTLGLTVNI